MKKFLATLLALIVAFAFVQPAISEDTADAKADLDALVEKIKAKLTAGESSEEALAAELKEFDTLLEKHGKEKTDDVAQILFMKAMLYLQVVENPEKALALVEKMKKDYPETSQGKAADEIITSIAKMVAAKKIQADLVEGATFPDFEEKDLNGKPLSVANYKGKVVLIDFWATWCGPCIQELPNVLAAYESFHEKGFDIIGISLDKDEEALKSFIEKRKMPWAQFFDGQGWGNKLAGRYGITAIPMTFLLDKEGKIAAKNLRGEELKRAVEKLVQ